MNLTHAIKSICQCGFITDAPMFSGKKGADVGSYDGRSLMFDSGSSQYGTRLMADGDRTTWTFSAWVKRSKLGAVQSLLGSYSNSNSYGTIEIDSNDNLRWERVNGGSVERRIITNTVYRDTAAFMHILLVMDTNNATQSDRVRLYVNGQRITDLGTENYPSSGYSTMINANYDHYLGSRVTSTENLDGYLADINFLDGIAATPSDFGYTSADTGEWVPKPYTGSYGTDGFHLDFSDTTSFTTLGADSSGNGNDFTLNNYSGTTTDYAVLDTPIRGYPVLNAIDTGSGTLSEGNLVSTSTTDRSATVALWNGKYAWSVTADSAGAFGVVERDLGGTENTYSASSSDALEFELDMDNGTLDVRVNGGSATSVATGLSAPQIPLFKAACTVDFGQRGFTPTDSRFKALSTANMPERKTPNPRKFFTPLLYTGNGATGHKINGALFQPNFVGIKNRDAADNHKVTDSVRGVTNEIEANTTDAEVTNADGLTAFDSDGFTVGADVEYNTNAEAYVAWLAKISALAGFDIQSYTSDGVAGRTVAHDLGKVPDAILGKELTVANSWGVYINGGQVSDPETDYLELDTTIAAADSNLLWNDTVPDSSNVTLGTAGRINNSGDDYVLYLFADDGLDTIYVVGSYTGNGSADGPFVHTRGRPQWLMTKRWDSIGNWIVKDTQRSPYNVADEVLYPNLTNTEASSRNLDILSNGFKCRDTNTDINASGGTYIFIAALAAHDKYARAA